MTDHRDDHHDAPIPPFLRSRQHPEDDPDTDGDDDLPVATRIVQPGRGGRGWETPYAPATPNRDETGARQERRRDRLQRLLHEVVDLALDDALDRLRPELHARLRNHLELHLPDLIDEALRAADRRDAADLE